MIDTSQTAPANNFGARLTAPATDRRAAHRQRVLKSGTIRFNNGYGALQCRIRNLNQYGAMVELGETTGVPSVFNFEIRDEPGMRDAEVIWRTPTRIGIRFG